MANIKVAVRVRPLSTRESKNSGSSVVVSTEDNKVSLTNLKIPLNKTGDSRERTRKYEFDYCFDSSDPRSKNYASQGKIYEILGKSLLDDLFAGYNTCLLAYGQSSSGKTYTMMGTEEEPGLTPRICQGIFARIEEEKGKDIAFRISVSYLEILNERVRDLLEPSSSSHRNLRIREHPRLGPYVQGLTRRAACTLERLMSYIEGGTKARRTSSTSLNGQSGRGHTVLTLFLTPETAKTRDRPIGESVVAERTDEGYVGKVVESVSPIGHLGVAPRYGSKLHLVDLAGSETARNCDGANRLKESRNINKSLVALGNVILALTGRASTVPTPNKRYIPYRDSTLTWLLKDALGGNATTVMLATISPASRNYNETAHTLRFAERAHGVVNEPVVNEDPMARTIRELRAEIARLKSLLIEKSIESNGDSERKKTRPVGEPVSDERPVLLLERGNIMEDGVIPIARRVNSSENIVTRENDLVCRRVRKSGSYECLDRKSVVPRTGYSYNRAKISELEEEERELVDEINETVFVDIPTLVAVLIKPDNNLDESPTAQIEEISSEEINEYPIESDFIDERKGDRENVASNGREKDVERRFDSLGSSVVGYNRYGESREPGNVAVDAILRTEKTRFRKQESVNIATPVDPRSTNLYALSRNFGSAEIFEKRSIDRPATLERSHTSLEKETAVPEEDQERYSQRDSKKAESYGNLWKEGNKFERTGSNESERIPKDTSCVNIGKTRNSATRKPSLESLKRKTSKDSSSSSSKDEQISGREFARRKDSLDHNGSIRSHTPVQRAKRAEIVAAVTERLYSSRKQVEETTSAVTGSTATSFSLVSGSSTSAVSAGSGLHSPPEGNEVRPTSTGSAFAAKSKLQEISRKMLAKRRRVNADTQTEQFQTIRMKDSASLTDEKKILSQDVGILTDEHEIRETRIETTGRLPVLRVKEIATLTDKLRNEVKESKDAECLVNDLNFYEYGVRSLYKEGTEQQDENARCDTANKMSNTDSLKLSLTNDEKIDRFDKSTSTRTRRAILSVEEPESVVVELPQPKELCFGEKTCKNMPQEPKESNSPLERPERPEGNVVSMSLPNSIGITIETTTNLLESRVTLIPEETTDESKASLLKGRVIDFKNNESQTEKQEVERSRDKESLNFFQGFPTKSSILNQTVDNKCFRIENIFKDPRNVSRIITAEGASKTPSEDSRGSKTSVTFTNSLGTCFVPETKECATGTEKMHTSGEISGRSVRGKRFEEPLHPTDVWKNWIISFPPVSWQRSRNLLSTVNVEPWNSFTWNGSLTSLNDEYTNVVDRTNSKTSCEQNDQSSPYNQYHLMDLKSPSLIAKVNQNKVIEQDYSFSDDSLDYNEENVLSHEGNDYNKKTEDLEEKEEGVENICPPDVVAHTKREHSVLVGNSTCNDGIEFSIARPFGDSKIEFSKKSCDFGEAELSLDVCDYKSVILREDSSLSTINVDDDIIPESRIDVQERSLADSRNDVPQKKVTFLDSESWKERGSDGSRSDVTSPLPIPNRSSPTTVIKRQVSKDKSTESCKEEDSVENSRSDSDSYEDADIDPDFIDKWISMKLKRKVLEEYLNEATIFMRNVNSLNEYVSSNVGLCGRRPQREEKERKNHRRSFVRRKYENCAAFVDDDLTNEEISPGESLENLLESLARLENCIRKTNEHDRYLREKYAIGVESTGAKSSLANSSIDSNTNSNISSSFTQRDKIVSVQKEIPIRSKTFEHSLRKVPFKDFSTVRLNEESEDLSLSTSCRCCYTKSTHIEHLCRGREGNEPSRRTVTDSTMTRTKSETSNFINSGSFHRLAITDTKSYPWKRWRYRSESPRAKFLELLRERRRIVESSRDVRS